MRRTNDNSPAEEPREDEQQDSDFWSDEGARRFNEALDEGRDYARSHGSVSYDPEDCLDDQECEYRDPDFCDPNEETLSPGEMELIFENSYIF